jgi:hypothetical protein
VSRTYTESTQVKAARQFDLACQRRDLEAVRRLAVQLHQHLRPDEPVDLSRVRFMVRMYAGEIHGWDIP